MRIAHWVNKEGSGLFRTTVELAKYEEKAGHSISLRSPDTNETFYGFTDNDFDIHCIHSQLHPHCLKDNKPKMLFMHGEPDYGMIGMGSVSAIMDLIPFMDAAIAFNPDEARIWNSFKRTYVIQKGIDLERYKPIKHKEKLAGEPSILYIEHWRSFRHPLHSLVALETAKKTLTKLRFYPFGCHEDNQKFWLRLLRQNQYNRFTPGMFKSQKKIPEIMGLVDMVISPVFPSYGRVSLEALACDKPVVAYNTNPHTDYTCPPYDPDALAECVIKCWQDKPTGQREYAEKNLDAKVMAEQAIEIYRRFV